MQLSEECPVELIRRHVELYLARDTRVWEDAQGLHPSIELQTCLRKKKIDPDQYMYINTYLTPQKPQSVPIKLTISSRTGRPFSFVEG